MFSMLNAIGEISKVADFTTPCVNIADSAFTQLVGAKMDKTPCKVELRLNLACWCLTEKKIVEILLFVGDNEQVAHSV